MEERLRRLAELKDRYDKHQLMAAAIASGMGDVMSSQLADLQRACPHENVVETDNAYPVYDCACDHHYPAARQCLVCGVVEGACELIDAEFYRLTAVPKAKVGREEFVRLHREFAYRAFERADR
jgi:hypothetical protein